ncbi:hypothetical protein COV17_02255 [Candidatus Woesearchaeota archaeon CG10_big_fil_rev_8_21_14_0_10_36_11]|nr:MAG: hypothetical protein COV17_02255 [Candidatus Woesearchaeota archaeon CG10_big_fil_rev_8_21_14_0_10_36_11]
MIKVILFDFWGTLVENGVWSPIKQVRNILQIQLPFPEYVVRMERAMMTKKFSSLKNAFESVCTEFNIEPNPEQIETLVGMWNSSWMLAQPYEETKETLAKLKEKFTLVLVSNTDSVSITNVLEKFGLQDFFSTIFLSCDIGMIKTDKNFLKHVLTTLNVSVEDSVMIGDSIQSDMVPAQQMGMKTVLIDRRKTREYPYKIHNLNQLEGVLYD